MWLFDAYPHPSKSGIVVWLRGERMEQRFIPYKPELCVAGMPLERAQKTLADDPRVEAMRRDRRRLWLGGPEEEVLMVRPRRLQQMFGVATSFRRRTHCRAMLFDVDHAPESRWSYDQGVFLMARVTPDLELVPGEHQHLLDYHDPELSTLRLGVRVHQQGPQRAFTDPLEAILVDGEEISGDERGALLSLARILKGRDPDVILTRHGDRFDIPYLLRCIHALGLQDRVRLGRAPDPHPDKPDQESKSLHTYGRWLHKSHAYYLRGRWHIDLAKKALDSEDDRKDLHGVIYVSRISNRRPQDINRNGAGYALQQMQVDRARDRGVALPWKRNLAEDWKDAATLCAVDRGGQIMNPQPGIYEDVAACDFSGYYPSLVVAHNLSSDTLNCDCCPDGPIIPELNYHVCTKRLGHQAEVLKAILPHRSYVKAVLKKARHK
jgi:hypothetical protein